MQKIKRGSYKSNSALRVFFKTLIITAICIVLIAVGFFGAQYLSALI